MDLTIADSSRGNASQSRIDVDDSKGDTSFGQPGSASFQVGNDETSISQMVQGDSMQNSFDSSEHHLQVPPSYEQLQQQQQEAIISDQASSQNVIFGQAGGPPTSFSRDMFPQPNNDSGTVRKQISVMVLKFTRIAQCLFHII